MDDSLQRAVYMVVELFFILFLVAAGIHFSNQTPLNDITKAYLEVACTNGGFREEDIQNLKDELSRNGYDPSALVIRISPADAVNITSTRYVPRGEIISLQVIYEKQGMLDYLFKRLGSNTDINNSAIRYGMSEKY